MQLTNVKHALASADPLMRDLVLVDGMQSGLRSSAAWLRRVNEPGVTNATARDLLAQANGAVRGVRHGLAEHHPGLAPFILERSSTHWAGVRLLGTPYGATPPEQTLLDGAARLATKFDDEATTLQSLADELRGQVRARLMEGIAALDT